MTQTITDRADDERYQALRALAAEGNEEAAADLFREYGVVVCGEVES